MNQVKTLAFWVLILGPLSLNATFLRGRIVALTKSSPAFEKASIKSTLLGKLPRGSLLLLLRKSPRGTWLELEDLDQNKFWIPKSRTDFIEIPQMRSWPNTQQAPYSTAANNPQSPFTTQRMEEAPRKNAPSKKSFSSKNSILTAHQLGITYRHAFEDSFGNPSLGLLYSYFPAQKKPSLYYKKQASEKMGLLLGAFFTQKLEEAFAVPLRIKMLRQKNSFLWSGMDIGLLWESTQNNKTQFLNFSAGYTWELQLAPFLSLSLRPGVELFSKTRFALEVALEGRF